MAQPHHDEPPFYHLQPNIYCENAHRILAPHLLFRFVTDTSNWFEVITFRAGSQTQILTSLTRSP